MFLKQTKCKICRRRGITLLNLKFNNQKILNFFVSEYDKKISNFLKKKIGNKNFILKKCSDCQFIWQKNMPTKFFLKQLYDYIIDPDESLKKSKKTTTFQIKNYEREINFIQNF